MPRTAILAPPCGFSRDGCNEAVRAQAFLRRKRVRVAHRHLVAMRPRREVIADWTHAVGVRVPIVLGDRGGFEFGEPAVAYEGERARYGVIGWDPALRWVLVLDEPGREPDGGPPAPRASPFAA